MGRISMPQGKGSQLHNRREYDKIGRAVPDNIDVNLSDQNVTIFDKEIKQSYDEIFGEALKEYNQKQKRADRKIENYYDHISKSKNGEKLFYEDVLQWGKKEDFEAHPELKELAKDCLEDYARSFQERNPNLKVIGAYIHMDEASPHLHLDYIPVAHGYSRGLGTRNSLDRAMKEMGFVPEKESRKNNATKLWKENEREYFATICRSRGLEVEAERKARGSLSVEEYKEAKDNMLGGLEQEKQKLENELSTKSADLDQKAKELQKVDAITLLLTQEDREPIHLQDFTIPEKKTFLGRVEEPERQGTFVEGLDKGQVKSIMQRVNVDEGLESAFDRTQERCNAIIQKAKEDAKEIRSEASAEKNETVAKAQEIVNQQNLIIQKAKEWADNLKKKYNELVKKLNELLDKKSKLEQEVAQIEAYKGKLEPLRQEYEELTRANQIMSGKLDNEITQARFRDWDTMSTWASYDEYRKRGELLALYKDGTVRKVGRNENGGWDRKTLDDQEKGLCRVGIMEDEERVSVPRSVLKELIGARDRTEPISKNLQNLIQQQSDVNRTIDRHRGRSR